MNIILSRRRILAAAGVFLAVAIVLGGVWLIADRDGGSAPPPPAGQPSASTSPTSQVMTVRVYFHRGQGADPDTVVAVDRIVPKDPMVATAALNQLLAGPTDTERAAGYWSQFSAATAGTLRNVRIGNGVAHADFRDFSRLIPGASSSAGSAALLAELNATLKEFSTVETTVYSFDGDVAAFYEWLQMVPPNAMAPGPRDALAAARDFLTLVGIGGLAEERFRATGPDTGTIDFHPRFGEDGVTPVSGPVTTVSLRRTPATWTVLGVTTDTIRVSVPTRMQAVSSPVALAGTSNAHEGTVNVRVVQVAGSVATILGEGFVNGGSGPEGMRPFHGQVSFRSPTANSGWVLCYEISAVDGSFSKMTAVPVTFAAVPQPPRVVSVTTAPALVAPNGWVTLSGSGRITVTVHAAGADRVQLYLTTLNTATAPTATLLGTATRAGNVFTYAWRYRDEPILAQLSIVATGSGGRIEQIPFNAYHG